MGIQMLEGPGMLINQWKLKQKQQGFGTNVLVKSLFLL
jgi:hypothetical protein